MLVVAIRCHQTQILSKIRVPGELPTTRSWTVPATGVLPTVRSRTGPVIGVLLTVKSWTEPGKVVVKLPTMRS